MSHKDPYIFPFKFKYEQIRHTVQEGPTEPGLTPRAVLDALVDNSSAPGPAPAVVDDDDEDQYSVGSMGANLALGRETAVYKGHSSPSFMASRGVEHYPAC